MKKLIILSTVFLWIFSCQSTHPAKSDANLAQGKYLSLSIKVGAERIDQYLPLIKGKQVALVVNQTSTIGNVHLVDSLKNLGITIQKVFAPEHGFRGDHSDGAHVASGIDAKTGIKIVSLYGSNKRLSAEMLNDVDVVIFDIQDVGVRFYTFISTMHYVMEACAQLNKKCIVLDRPNPNGFYTDGPVLDLKYQSFIGMHPIPIVHGLTVGELALMINGEGWLEGEIQCDLNVVSCLDYDHYMRYSLPIKPSPNLPNMNSIYLYPFLGLFEGTNVSVGRGTEHPFQMIGRPHFNGEIEFTPRSIPGVSDHPKYEGEVCGGFMVEDVVRGNHFFYTGLNLSYLLEFYRTNKEVNGPFFRDFFLKLSGNAELKAQIESGLDEEQIRLSWLDDLSEYRALRKKYLLYP